MEELILNGEYYLEQIDKVIKKHNGYRHYKGDRDTIGESILLMYSDDNPAWVLTFLLINISVGRNHNLYRLIYKYTG